MMTFISMKSEHSQNIRSDSRISRFLADCGIDAVKADVQSAINELDNGEDRARLTMPYESALKSSARKHFENKVIYCMCHQSDVLFGYLLPKDRTPVLCRNSDGVYT